MHFRILGDLTDVETIATGRAFAKSHAFASAMGADGGENARASQKLSSPAGKSYPPSYTGTRRLELDAANSRSSASYEVTSRWLKQLSA
jgi:hypothetical protein